MEWHGWGRRRRRRPRRAVAAVAGGWGRGKGGGEERRWRRRSVALLKVRVRACARAGLTGAEGKRGLCHKAAPEEGACWLAGARGGRRRWLVEQRATSPDTLCMRGGRGTVTRESRLEGEDEGENARKGRRMGHEAPSLPPSQGAAAAACRRRSRRHFGFALRRGRRSPSRLRDPPSPQFPRLAPRLLSSHLPVRSPAGCLLDKREDPLGTKGSGGACGGRPPSSSPTSLHSHLPRPRPLTR